MKTSNSLLPLYFYPSCRFYFLIFLTTASLLHLPSSHSPCGYLWPGMCRAGQRARALVMCGCRRPPSLIAPADITDNYSFATVKTQHCHTQSRSAWWIKRKGGCAGIGGALCILAHVGTVTACSGCFWASLSESDTQVCHFKISSWAIRPTRNQSGPVSRAHTALLMSPSVVQH